MISQSPINAVPSWALTLIVIFSSVYIFTLRRSSPLLVALVVTAFLALRVFNAKSTLERRVWGPIAFIPIVLWVLASPVRTLIFEGTF